MITHASVFSGIGGTEIAATMLGWDNVFHCELNPFGRAVLDYWYPKAKSYEDITKTDFSEWRGRVDVLTGGFPCQPFSYAGQRRGADDDRYLWPHMFRCIDQVRPAWVVAENVAGILTMVEQGEVSAMESQGTLFDEGDGVRRHRLIETFTLQRICDDLEGHGYEVQPVLVPACAVGAPHRRDRVFIVARRVVADTDNHRDVRTAREDEEKSREERIQERHEVQQPDEPDQVRREGEGAASTDTDLQRRNQPVATTEPSEEERLYCEENIDGRDIAYTERPATDTRSDGRPQEDIRRESRGRTSDGKDDEQPQSVFNRAGYGAGEWGDYCGERWQNFPSVSPVHRGNDGLPFPLDDLAIPASKWRTESLKAYGNAIVPQVMYEIFRAIEIIEENIKQEHNEKD